MAKGDNRRQTETARSNEVGLMDYGLGFSGYTINSRVEGFGSRG